MSDKAYGYCLAGIMAAIPGLCGVWGVIAGLWQGRWGPVVVGAIFLWIAYYAFKILAIAANRRARVVPKPINWHAEPKELKEILF